MQRSPVAFGSWGPIALATIVTVILVFIATRTMAHPSWVSGLLVGLTVLAIASFFAGLLRESQLRERSLLRRNQELFALYQAGLDIHGELALNEVLQDIVDRARGLLDARYGALSIIDGEGNILEFVTSGISQAQRDSIGDPPIGRGLLAVPLVEGHRLRVSDIGGDSRSAGFPENHPQMKSLLAVPLQCSELQGNLYLADKETALEFSEEDEEMLVRFARLAGLAVDTAERHDRLTVAAVSDERVRIARELHDGLAQDLAAVGIRAQVATTEFGSGNLHEAARQLADIETSARLLQRDIREEIGGLRNMTETGGTLQEAARNYTAEWSEQHGVRVDLELSGQTRVEPEVRLQFQRIVQEALSNIAKHAEASSVKVSVAPENGWVRTEIRDDGRGFHEPEGSPVRRGGFGLRIMKERAQAVGGSFGIESEAGTGTHVHFKLPVRAEMN